MIETLLNFHGIVDKSAEGILVVDAQGVIRYANPAARLLLGGPGAPVLIGQRFDHPRLDDGVFELPVRTTASGEGLAEAVVAQTEWQGQAARLIFLRDVTERERLDRQLRRAENLETVGLLAGGIAHDFNNLLSGILGNISFARSAAGTHDPLQEVLGEAERAALRAKALTQQLLTFAKGGAPVRQAARVGDLLEESVRFILAGSNCAYRLNLAPDLWNAFMDAGQISEVIENIVINADQAMPGGGTVEITADNFMCAPDNSPAPITLKPGRYVRMAITDGGVGMPPEVMARVFNPYFTTKPTGSGLGLAVAYSVIRKHDGAIAVASREGVGTTFTVYLPATDEPVVTEEEVGDAEPPRGHGRIMVMDDEAFIRSLVVRMLKSLGYEAESVAHGEEAVACYRQALGEGRRFDAVILDLTIPGGMGGVDTMQALHALDPKVRAIVSSGYSLEPVFSSYESYGFRGGIAKPYDMKTLAVAVADVLRQP